MSILKIFLKIEKKIKRYKFKNDKILSLGAAILLDIGLKRIGERNIKIIHNDYGKPYFKDFEKINFNISHSGEYVVCCFSDKEIGVDIEKIRNHNIEIAKSFFCETEFNYIKKFNGYEQSKAFLRLWTMKESYVKKIGVGLHMPLNKFEIKLDNNIYIYRWKRREMLFTRN